MELVYIQPTYHFILSNKNSPIYLRKGEWEAGEEKNLSEGVECVLGLILFSQCFRLKWANYV